MKTLLIHAALFTAIPLAANAQTAPAPAAPAPAPAPAAAPAGVLNGDTPIETIMASPAGKAALTKQFPDIPGHPAYDQFKGMSLRQLAPMAGGLITDEKIAAFEADVKGAK